MTLQEAMEKMRELRDEAERTAADAYLICGKLERLGEAVAFDKMVEVLDIAALRDKGLKDAAHTAGLIAKRYAMLCGSLEDENEHDSNYYGGQAAGFAKAKELLSEGAEEALA